MINLRRQPFFASSLPLPDISPETEMRKTLSSTATIQNYRHRRGHRRTAGSPILFLMQIIINSSILIVAIGALDVAEHTGPDGRCHNFVSTKPITDGTSSAGMLFAIKSRRMDNNGPTITSLGFHLDPLDEALDEKLEYELYALKREGYYASPERQTSISGLINKTAAINNNINNNGVYDFRGQSKLNEWKKIAEGTIVNANLTKDSTTLNVQSKDFFQIPFGLFNTTIPPKGGIQSFYITTKTSGFIYSTSVGKTVNDAMELIKGRLSDNAPEILVGESAVTYPMPDGGMMYAPRSFVGKVFYEKECPSYAPSQSTSPSLPPTIAFSGSPSSAPSTSSIPTNEPSEFPSELPSSVPTNSPRKLRGGLSLSFKLACDANKDYLGNSAEIDTIADSVRGIAARGAKALDKGISKVNAIVVGVFCVVSSPFERHRRLPTGSSALDFSIVITGEYRPSSRPGERPPLPEDLNLGEVAEDSINRDPVGFVKDLKKRAAGTASAFMEVEADDLTTISFEVPTNEEDLKTTRITNSPTKSPTPRPTTVILSEEKNNDSILIICIVITGALVVLLGAFLLFRHGERNARKTQREKMERVEYLKERRRQERRERVEWEETNKHRIAGTDRNDDAKDIGRGGPPPQYGNSSMAFGQPPPQPNYFPGAPPLPQGYNYNYPTPPPYGHIYGGPNPQGYPYPPPAPPMTGAKYGQQPQKESRVSWKH
eukprot:CAMPEP_0181085262 /NCGR_PEP_ID=MMETSP1071-20121207/5140_1 /TAXON_ID=35127 /ORGANISM="Thalassiosira sp., Strain NH16" /LENGTH=714 /DNA_ID=CAMNT_0023167061 /DNA_START=10 /DNA_END=2154 /DNA_ORIENTATION=-